MGVEKTLKVLNDLAKKGLRERMLLLLDEAQVDMLCLENILERHGLQKKWREFRRRYDEE